MTQDFAHERRLMVEEHLKPRGIKSPAVLDAMLNVHRHLHVPENQQSFAYNDHPLSIGCGQTISQPYIVAFMTEHLEPVQGMKVLEIGTGSGYQTAVLAYLGCEVYSVELLETFAEKAKVMFAGHSNVHIKCGDGFAGWLFEAPFDGIIVTAAPPQLPLRLTQQLCDGGRMIVPVGEVTEVQWLRRITKKDEGLEQEDLLPVRFVPMLPGSVL